MCCQKSEYVSLRQTNSNNNDAFFSLYLQPVNIWQANVYERLLLLSTSIRNKLSLSVDILNLSYFGDKLYMSGLGTFCIFFFGGDIVDFFGDKLNI